MGSAKTEDFISRKITGNSEESHLGRNLCETHTGIQRNSGASYGNFFSWSLKHPDNRTPRLDGDSAF